MLCGTSQHPLDAKNRVFVPKRIQDGLTRTATGGLQGFLTPGEDGCLYLFPVAGFQAAADELSTRVFTSDEVRAARRLFFGASVPIELDSSGRIVIPEDLRARSGIGKEVVIVGVDDKAELWSVETWKTYSQKHRGVLNKLDRVAGERSASSSSPGPGT